MPFLGSSLARVRFAGHWILFRVIEDRLGIILRLKERK